MKILIIGGTGAMGMHLVSILAKQKEYKIIVTSRKERKGSENVCYIQGDSHNLNFMENILKEKFDVVVDFMAYNTKEFSSRYNIFLDNSGQYIFLSSARVYADSEKPISEDSPRLFDVCTDDEFLATDEYAISKARQENILFNSERRNWTIVRPYITYAENRLQLGTLEKERWLSRALVGKTVLFSSEIASKKTTLTYGGDVAVGIVSLIGNKKAFGEAFHITQGKSLLWSEIWEIYKPIIEKYTSQKAKIFYTDIKTFSFSLFANEYQIKYDRLFNRVFDNSKIAKFLDVTNFITPEIGLKRCLEQFIEDGGNFLNSYYSTEGRVDKITHEFYLPWEIHGLKNMARYYIRRIGI